MCIRDSPSFRIFDYANSLANQLLDGLYESGKIRVFSLKKPFGLVFRQFCTDSVSSLPKPMCLPAVLLRLGKNNKNLI